MTKKSHARLQRDALKKKGAVEIVATTDVTRESTMSSTIPLDAFKEEAIQKCIVDGIRSAAVNMYRDSLALNASIETSLNQANPPI